MNLFLESDMVSPYDYLSLFSRVSLITKILREMFTIIFKLAHETSVDR